MARLDPALEKQRLIEFYSGQLDGELEKVATEAYELTEAAREVLKGGDLTKGSRSRGCRKCSGHHQERTGINAW